MKNMASGKNRTMNDSILKVIIAVIGCMTMFFVHDLGREIYMFYYTPKSHGVGLGFVRFFIVCFSFPLIIISCFLLKKYSFFISVVLFLCFFYFFFRTTPLRVMLVLISYIISYAFVLFLKYILCKQ